MRCHIIAHTHFETPGSIADWAQNKRLELVIHHPYRGDALPSVDAFEPVILLGGPQSAREYQRYPYLEQEVEWIKKHLTVKNPLLGICLGAQLIGESLGAATELSPEKEVGAFPLILTQEGKQHALLQGLPDTFTVMHWHNDMPGLTQDAKILAYSGGCPRQIVAYAPHVLGLQCHFEATNEWLNLLLEHASNDLKPSLYTQTAQEMQKVNFQAMNEHLHRILDKWYINTPVSVS